LFKIRYWQSGISAVARLSMLWKSDWENGWILLTGVNEVTFVRAYCGTV